MGVTFSERGDFSKTNSFFQRMLESVDLSILDKYGRRGVELLRNATPVDTGVTADSWYYTIEHDKGQARLIFSNSNIVRGMSIALLIQYGHATRNGGWIEGVDYINPALKPLFEELANEAWKEVTKS